jgi:fatty-acid desaturase
MDTREYRMWSRVQIPLAIVALLIGAPFGLEAFFWLGPIRLAVALHAQCCVNSVCHMRKGVELSQGTACNVPWLTLLHFFQGENWHRNHHDRPGSARLGWGLTQPDLGWVTIRVLAWLRLASHVHSPRVAYDSAGEPVHTGSIAPEHG